MGLIHLENENFSSIISNGRVLVDFYADWCGPCKMIAPFIEEISNIQDNVKVVKINIDEHEDIARQYGIMSIPTIMVFNNGKEEVKHIGYLPKEELLNLIK